MALSKGNHGVIVIHGIGDNMKRGNLLADITNSLADTLMESPQNGIRPKIDREADLDNKPASVTLTIQSPGGELSKWICKEAFWDDAFPPPKAATVLWWLLTKNLFNQIKFIWQGIRKDPANDKSFIPEEDIEAEIAAHPKEPPVGTENNAKKPTKSLIYSKGGMTGVFIIPLAVITYIALFFVWICQYLPSIGPLEKVLQWVHKLDPFLSNAMGDVQKYVENGIWSANARRRLEEVIIAMLEDKYGAVDDITIVAHSMGCVVTYDALAEGGKVAKKVKSLLDERKKEKKITFVSVGSAINQVFRLAKKSSPYAQEQFKRRLAKEITGFKGTRGKENKALKDKFYWLDIYARLDPVAAGKLDNDVITQAEIDPEYQVKRRKVINTDNIMFDHTSYWANKDTVIPRIVRAINGGIEDPWLEAGITTERKARRVKYAARFGRFTWITIIVVVAAVCVVVGLKIAGII